MWVTAYTDASFREGKAGWAVWLRSEKGRIIEKGPCPDHITNSFLAEMYAVQRAVEIAAERWPQTKGVQINTDVLCFIKAFYPWSVPMTGESARALQVEIRSLALRLGVRLFVKHVKAHTGRDNVRAWINSRVDGMAKSEMRKL